MTVEKPLLGFHTSINGGLDKAPGRIKKLNCNTGQIFTKSNRQWKARDFYENEVENFKQESPKISGPIVAHSSYLINLGNPKPTTWEKSIAALVLELSRTAQLGIMDLILHPGLHVGSGEKSGLQRIAVGLNQALEKSPDSQTRICLEITAGQGSSLGYKFEHLSELRRRVNDAKRISFCLDTCHMFGAGYDLRSEKSYEKTMGRAESVLGLDLIKAIHLNDSKNSCGSNKDRHAHIGEGNIGETGFRCLMQDSRWAKTPKILETPIDDSWQESYRKNLDTLLGFLN